MMNGRYQIKIRKTFCKGCELCLTVCPRHVLKLSKDVNEHGFYFAMPAKNTCAGCRQCAIICPEAAIEIYKKVRGSQLKNGKTE